MKHVTKEMEGLRASLESCANLPKGKVSIMRWWIREKIFPYIHRQFNPFTVGDLCRYFRISLRRYMYYRWQRMWAQ